MGNPRRLWGGSVVDRGPMRSQIRTDSGSSSIWGSIWGSICSLSGVDPRSIPGRFPADPGRSRGKSGTIQGRLEDERHAQHMCWSMALRVRGPWIGRLLRTPRATTRAFPAARSAGLFPGGEHALRDERPEDAAAGPGDHLGALEAACPQDRARPRTHTRAAARRAHVLGGRDANVEPDHPHYASDSEAQRTSTQSVACCAGASDSHFALLATVAGLQRKFEVQVRGDGARVLCTRGLLVHTGGRRVCTRVQAGSARACARARAPARRRARAPRGRRAHAWHARDRAAPTETSAYTEVSGPQFQLRPFRRLQAATRTSGTGSASSSTP